MSNYFKSIEELISQLPALSTYLSNAGNYFAHLPKSNFNQQKETLEEHVNLVNDYFKELVKTHRLDEIVDKIIADYQVNLEEKNGNYLKKLFVNTIVFHDFGKVNEYFQVEKMENDSFKNSLATNSPISSTHSALSAYIYLTKHLNEIAIEHNFNPQLVTACIYLSYSIFKHHGKIFMDDSLETVDFADFQAKFKFEDVSIFLSKYLRDFGYNLNPQILQLVGKNTWLKNQHKLIEKNTFSLYALCRLNFSLLTASDYLATNEYMNDAKLKDFGILSKERIDEIYQFVSTENWINEAENKKNYNKLVFEKIDNHELTYPTIASGENLNVLRTEMAIEVIRNIREHHTNNLFYIEAPTGGGKTNLSALATIELLKIYEGKYNKVFYVFPFTTLITQTYKSLKETLGLKDDEMVELHSNAGMKVSEEDDQYGNEKFNYINNLFVNYPFAFLSHIRFFDILKTNEKETNYLLHRLANSIVVIDELQSYSPEHWDKVIYFVKQYAEKFNIKFILMSATLPKLDKLNVIKENVHDFVYLLPNEIVVAERVKKKYFTNLNFSGRVNFNFDYFDKTDLQLEEIAKRLILESKNYADKDFGDAKPKGSVYTIIEFIFKKTATEFYPIVEQANYFDKIFVLSGTILSHRRKEIINFLKNKSNRKKKILLITTQVVEAGVDIDMDLGFKDRSLIDSDEQLAGRINRNVNKKDCVLFLFNYNKETFIYGNDERLKQTKNNINSTQYREILDDKNFDLLYNLVLQEKNKLNQSDLIQNFSDYENHIKHLRFQSVHDQFKLIDQNNICCFIPLNVPIEVDGVIDNQKDAVFTKHELAFLAKNNVVPNLVRKIEGEKVFDLYIGLIKNKQEFVKQKTDMKTLQGIMSKYVFSLFANPNVLKQLVHFSDEEKSEFGYKYIARWNDFYSIESGMNDKDFNSNETQFL